MKLCGRCQEQKAFSEFYRGSKKSGSEYQAYCKPCAKAYSTAWRSSLSGDRLGHQREGYRHRATTERRSLRTQVIEAYGGRCECCAEDAPEFLSIDHVDNDGAEQRRRLGISGSHATYRMLREAGYPREGYQLLCFNCNLSLGFSGYCPHRPDVRRAVIRRPRLPLQ